MCLKTFTSRSLACTLAMWLYFAQALFKDGGLEVLVAVILCHTLSFDGHRYHRRTLKSCRSCWPEDGASTTCGPRVGESRHLEPNSARHGADLSGAVAHSYSQDGLLQTAKLSSLSAVSWPGL